MTSPVPLAGSSQRTIPYDYSFQFDLEGVPNKLHQKAISVSVEGTFTAVSIGYGFTPETTVVEFGPVVQQIVIGLAGVPNPALRNVTLGEILSGADAALAATDTDSVDATFEISPQVRGLLDDALPDDAFERSFRIVARPAPQIQFLYALFDEGTGRAFQNEPVLSTAGLGDPDGERPFRHFAMPIAFEPLTAIRLDVTETSDFKGTLHFALHGYKTLGLPGSPTGQGMQFRRRRTR